MYIMQGITYVVYILHCLLRNALGYIDGLMQERRNSIASAPELRLSCTRPSKWSNCHQPNRSWLITIIQMPWWRHQMETFSALLAICAGNSPVTGEFLAQRPVTRSFNVFFDLRLNKQLSKQSRGWWFDTLSRPLWRHCNEVIGRRHSLHTPTFLLFLRCNLSIKMAYQQISPRVNSLRPSDAYVRR